MKNNINEQLFFLGEQYFNQLLLDIAQATTSIELETFIFAFDRLGLQLLASLTQAAQRGVKVRLLVDGAGTPQWHHRKLTQLEHTGAETRIFHPFPWRLWQWSRSHLHLSLLLKMIYLLLKINSRNHRKVCIIDQKIAYIGSFNISQHHLSKQFNGQGWRDTGVRLANYNLQELNLAFEAAWTHQPIQERIRQFFQHLKTNPIIRLNNTRHRRRILYKNLLTRLKKCRQRIWITNAYFVPDNFLLRRLIEAAQNKIDVRILLPSRSDIAFMPWASDSFYTQLLKAGVRIFEYQPSMLHAKTLILDNWMTIGSSNLNHRSLLHDLEVDITICSLPAKFMLSQQFLIDLQYAKEINLTTWQPRPWYQRLVGRIVLYLKFFI